MALAETQYGKFWYYAPDVIGRSIASGAFWDVHYRPWIDKLDSSSVFVDVGSNIGFFTIYAAKRGALVWSFEASPEVFSLLERNVSLNELELNIRVENIALYDKETELNLNPVWTDWPKLHNGLIDYEQNGNSGGMSLVENGVGPYKITARTLDSYALRKCDLIKIDTQGADFNVLIGASDTIQRCKPVICFEIEPYSELNYRKFCGLFESFNYSVTQVGRGDYNVDCVGVPNG